MSSQPVQFDRGREIRAQSLGVSFLGWFSRAAKYMRDEMVKNSSRLDDVIVSFVLSRMAMTYSAVTSFVLAHALGPVGFFTYHERRSSCASCQYKKTDLLGVVRCHGYADGTCGCPLKKWWRPGYLTYQLRLRNRVCPRGHFGRTRSKGLNHGD